MVPLEGDIQLLTDLLVGGALENWQLGLFHANITPAETDTAATYTAQEATFTNYKRKTLTRSVRNETSSLSLYAPQTIFNQKITGSRRFAAQDWPIERLRAIGSATGTTINDVVLAMCGGAVRRGTEGGGPGSAAGQPLRVRKPSTSCRVRMSLL